LPGAAGQKVTLRHPNYVALMSGLPQHTRMRDMEVFVITFGGDLGVWYRLLEGLGPRPDVPDVLRSSTRCCTLVS